MKLSLGAGGVRLPGWIHVDFDAGCRPDVRVDLSAPLPFADACADFLHSEDFIGQLSFAQARLFLQECYRVLKPGGVLRLLTPDLEQLVRAYVQRDLGLKNLWDREVGIPLETGTLGELVHAALSFADQKSFYDEETLRSLLEPAGFQVERVACNQSRYPTLCGLDYRTPDNAISLYLDCVKPAA
ncbi:MAG: class I SAM-dependent methyltransferase [Wenzhouxiangella sp.]